MVDVKVSRKLRAKPTEPVLCEDMSWYRAKACDEDAVFICFVYDNNVIYFGTNSGYGEDTQMGHDAIDVIYNGEVILLENISKRIKISIDINDK